jgi:hemerythrin-like domain-containing protein
MNPIETLINEHGLIRQFLDNLSMAVDKIENGQKPSAAFFEKGLDFAKSFADSYHHFKEEHVLFIRFAQKRQGEVDGQIDTLRQQHERGRELLSGISNALEGYAAQDPSKTADLLENVAAYTALLRHHIHIEDHIVYPMVSKKLNQEDLDMVAQEFENQRIKLGGDTFERCHKLVVDMGSILTHMR